MLRFFLKQSYFFYCYTLNNNADSRPRYITMFEDCYMDMYGGGSRDFARCRNSIHISSDVYDDVSTGWFSSQAL